MQQYHLDDSMLHGDLGFIVTARAKGLSRGAIIRGHVLRNSSLPVLTVMGHAFGVAMGGEVLTRLANLDAQFDISFNEHPNWAEA